MAERLPDHREEREVQARRQTRSASPALIPPREAEHGHRQKDGRDPLRQKQQEAVHLNNRDDERRAAETDPTVGMRSSVGGNSGQHVQNAQRVSESVDYSGDEPEPNFLSASFDDRQDKA